MPGRFRAIGDVNGKSEPCRSDDAAEVRAHYDWLVEVGATNVHVSIDEKDITEISDLDAFIPDAPS